MGAPCFDYSFKSLRHDYVPAVTMGVLGNRWTLNEHFIGPLSPDERNKLEYQKHIDEEAKKFFMSHSTLNKRGMA